MDSLSIEFSGVLGATSMKRPAPYFLPRKYWQRPSLRRKELQQPTRDIPSCLSWKRIARYDVEWLMRCWAQNEVQAKGLVRYNFRSNLWK